MYYAICVMYVVLGVNNLIFARENDTCIQSSYTKHNWCLVYQINQISQN